MSEREEFRNNEYKGAEHTKDIARQFTCQGRYRFAAIEGMDDLLRYENGRYIPGESWLFQKLEGYYSLTKHDKREVATHIIHANMRPRREFDADSDIVNVANGLLRLSTGELLPHSADYPSIIQLPVAYDVKAYGRKVWDFLYNVMDPSDVPLFIEYLAYCLLRNARFQKNLMCVGPPDSGKSTALKLLEAFLGSENITNKSLKQLTEDRFSAAALDHKLASIFADISDQTLKDIEAFKVITAGDTIDAEKKFRDSYSYRPYAKLIFSANFPPRPRDYFDDSYYKRWILIVFGLCEKCYFCKRDIVMDPALEDALRDPSELSGLLTAVAIAARRLLRRRKFCHNLSIEETADKYLRLADAAKAWMDDRCDLVDDYLAEKDALHEDFMKYCKERGLGILDKVHFGRRLAKFGIMDKQVGPKGKQKHYWIGLKLKDKPVHG
jgi:putative DNA primase/helicase